MTQTEVIYGPAITAKLGSISSGTTRTEDLLGAFSSCLDDLVRQEEEVIRKLPASDNRWGSWLRKKAGLMQLIAEAGEVDASSEEGEDQAHWVLDDLFNALGEYAPPYSYFGTHEGDGACYGFWPSMESVRELHQVADGDMARCLGEDCYAVNDHGNVTVYGGDGKVIWDCV